MWQVAAMCGLLAFIRGDPPMVAIHGWSNFASRWRGGKRAARAAQGLMVWNDGLNQKRKTS